MDGKLWRLVQTKSKLWFMVNIPDGVHNYFGQRARERYNYISKPLVEDVARDLLNEVLRKDGR